MCSVVKFTIMSDHYRRICLKQGEKPLLPISTLRNIYMKDYYELFEDYGVNNWKIRVRAENTYERYKAIQQILNKEATESGGSFNKQILDEFVFEQLFYTNMNVQYVYRFDDLYFTPETAMVQAESYIKQFSDLFYNRLISDITDNPDLNLCTTRIEGSEGRLVSIKMLIKCATIRTRSISSLDMYAGILIDVPNNFVVFKFNQNQLNYLKNEPLKLIGDLKEMLNGYGSQGKIYEPLNLNIISLNETSSRKTIFSLFKELSLDAEHILNLHAPEDTRERIESFLESMDVSESTENYEDYIEQIKAVVYQDISSTINKSLFKNGWVFRFVFREGKTTRAASRTEDFSPIYGSKIYWHLKELIFRQDEMYEAGFHWYLKKTDDDLQYVLVRIESRNDTIILNFYHKMRHERKERENFVLRKIDEYLPRD